MNKYISSVDMLIDDIRNLPLLSSDEEKELCLKIKNGDMSARDKLINSNIRLVMSISQKYSNFDYEDLVSEGMKGLIIAVDKFDPSLNIKFSTYATYWIRQVLGLYIANNSKVIRLPRYLFEIRGKLLKFEDNYFDKYGVKPSVLDISKALDVSLSDVKKVKNYNYNFISIDEALNDDENTFVSDIVPDNVDGIPEYAYLKNELDDMLSFVFDNTLNEDEKKVINKRYGFSDGIIETFASIGSELGFSTVRASQKHKAAIDKLRKSPLLDYISDYLDLDVFDQDFTSRLIRHR